MAAVSALIYLLIHSKDQLVHFVFPSMYLLKRDHAVFQELWSLNKLEDRVKHHVGLDFVKEPGSLLIYDESDAMLFSNPGQFNTFTGSNPCICLTATPGGKDGDLEEKVIKHLGLKVVKDQDHGPRLQADKFITDVLEFLQKSLMVQPALVYCTEAQVETFVADFKYTKDDEVLNDEIMANLEVKDNDKYHLLIVTKPELMRAIDYRAPNIGIALVICKPFNNEREAQQGLGRVGRNGDPCQRVQLKDVPLINEKEQKMYRAYLMEFFSKNIAKTFEVKSKSKATKKNEPVKG